MKGIKFTKAMRDGLLFFAGLGLTINEALRTASERPTLLLLYAAMMGFPFLLRADEARGTQNGDKKKPESEE